MAGWSNIEYLRSGALWLGCGRSTEGGGCCQSCCCAGHWCLAGLVASRVNIAIIYLVSTTQHSSDGDMPWICTSHLQLDATFNDPRCKWKWHFYAQQLLQHVAMLVWTIPASVMNSWCFGEVTAAAPPAAALQSHCCEGKMSSAANRLIGEVVQSHRRPLLGPSPGWKRILALSLLRH